MNGGYVLVDCDGLEINTDQKQTINGIFARVEKAYNTDKPIYAYNCEFNALKMSPVAVMVNPYTGGVYVCTASTLQIIVDPDDGVTINNFINNNYKRKEK